MNLLLSLWLAALHWAALALEDLAALPFDSPTRLDWERQLLNAHREGNPAAFDALYRAYAGILYARVLIPALRQPALAKDALSDTFERAHPKLAAFEATERSVYFWLARIARNVALDAARGAAVRRRLEPRLLAELAPLALPEPDPESALGAQEEAERMRRAVDATLSGLTPRYRRAIELRFFDNRSREACAQALEVTLSTFDVVLLRALRAFRRAWLAEP